MRELKDIDFILLDSWHFSIDWFFDLTLRHFDTFALSVFEKVIFRNISFI